MSNRQLMGRRSFLVMSSTCALATAVLGPRMFAGETASPPRKLAVGFMAFDRNAMVAAASIPAGDGGFIGRGARVVVSGASGPRMSPRNRRAVELLTHFPYFDGSERRQASFRAWGFSRLTGSQGSPVRFTVPVDEIQKISFSVAVEHGAPAAARREEALIHGATESAQLPVTLSVQNEPEALRLMRGYYVIVPQAEHDAEPHWSAWSLKAVDGRTALVDADGRIAPFEHFVLETDYATV
jgi:hypothetical protein